MLDILQCWLETAFRIRANSIVVFRDTRLPGSQILPQNAQINLWNIGKKKSKFFNLNKDGLQEDNKESKEEEKVSNLD